MNEGMTKSEREDLQRLLRQREKVLKSAAKQRSTEVLADFENQMGQEYSFDDDHVWAEAAKIANAAVSKAQEQIKARCREIGIPDRQRHHVIENHIEFIHIEPRYFDGLVDTSNTNFGNGNSQHPRRQPRLDRRLSRASI